MEDNVSDRLVPLQQEGAQSNVSEHINAKNEQEAKAIFNEAKERLLHVNSWKKISGNISASFALTKEDGDTLEREAHVGDFFKIDIPGPGTKTGNGYDWVRVEVIEDHSNESADRESFGMQVRPSANPR